ncbi:MAG: ATP-binding protein [Micromonosporaceae bacterium]
MAEAAGHPNADDIVTCASELAANAIRHTASGRSGFFAVEVTWAGATVRVAVADGGATTEPLWHQLSPGALEEAGRGLDIVTRLSTSFGSEGDDRGPVVWAQFRPVTKTAPTAARLPLYPQPAVDAAAAALARRLDALPGGHLMPPPR